MAKESIPLGLKYSCMLKDTAENDVLQEGGLRGSLLFSQKLLLIVWHSHDIKYLQGQPLDTYQFLALCQTIHQKLWSLGGRYLGRPRLQNLSPALGRPSQAYILLEAPLHTCLGQTGHTPGLFLPSLCTSREKAWTGLCMCLILRQKYTEQPGQHSACEPNRFWGYCPQAVSDITALGTSQNILWFSWIQENVQ